MVNLKGKSFLKILDLTNDELKHLLRLSRTVKAEKYNRIVNRPLDGKNIVVLFQKDSTRTRCSFEVAAKDLGMGVTYLGPSGSQFGTKESVADSAKVFGRLFDGIEFRGYKQSDVETLAKYSGIPVWNGLTDEWHPTQMIGDFMTIQEYFGQHLKGLKLVFVGDARNNVAKSLMVTSVKLGVNFVALSPPELAPDLDLVKQCEEIAKSTGGSVTLTSDIKTGTKDADVIYTDVWVSMGEKDWSKRINLLHTYQVNDAMIKNAKHDVVFLHCLPAFHNWETEIGSARGAEYGKRFPAVKNGEFEVTDKVFNSKHSKVFEQAENRMHSIKAIILATLG